MKVRLAVANAHFGELCTPDIISANKPNKNFGNKMPVM